MVLVIYIPFFLRIAYPKGYFAFEGLLRMAFRIPTTQYFTDAIIDLIVS